MCSLCGQSVLKSHLIIFIHSHFGLTIFFLKSWNHRVSWPGIRMQLQKGFAPLCYTFSLSWLGTYLHFFFSFWFACNHFLFLYAIMHCFMCVKRSFCFVYQDFFFLIKGFLNLNEKTLRLQEILYKAYLMKKFMFLFSCLRILSLVIKNLFWSLNLLSGILQHLYYRMMIVEGESNLIKMWSVDHGHSWGFKHSDPEYRYQFFDLLI